MLAFDHFFDQDLRALRSALDPADTVVVEPYQRLWHLARSHFPAAAFHTLAAAYEAPASESWRRYAPAAERVARRLLQATRPEVFVVPSDVFFYLRPVIQDFACHGVPTVVVQKETTISPMVMTAHAEQVREWTPFISDHMTVCSERQKQFWLNAGTDGAAITVTGQPRFDRYAGARAVARRPGPPRLLYLSYDDIAYLPSDTGVPFNGSWQALREGTERTLAAAAQRGWSVTAKRHPQQSASTDWLGAAVARAPQSADTRDLVADADVVVGFQTTALFEAAAAGRRIIYPAWGDVFDEAVDLLIPFHEMPGLVTHVRSSDELAATLAGGVEAIPPPGPEGRRLYEEHLGPVDGHASDRVITLLRAMAATGRYGARRRPSAAASRVVLEVSHLSRVARHRVTGQV